VDEETRRILDECYEVARTSLRTERHRLEALAETLLKKESLDLKEIREATGLTDVKADQDDPTSAMAEAVHSAATDAAGASDGPSTANGANGRTPAAAPLPDGSPASASVAPGSPGTGLERTDTEDRPASEPAAQGPSANAA
jgi:hypothetical protein